MNKFWQLSFSVAAIYAVGVVGMAAAISHYFLAHFAEAELSALISSTAILAFHALGLLVLSWIGSQSATDGWFLRLVKAATCTMHLGLVLFVYTVWAGLFDLPMHVKALAPVGGHLLLISWLLLAISPWFRK